MNDYSHCCCTRFAQFIQYVVNAVCLLTESQLSTVKPDRYLGCG